MYLALAAEAGVEGDCGQYPGSSSSSSTPQRATSGKKRARGDGETAITAAAAVEYSGGGGGGGDSGVGGRDRPVAKGRARSLLHATISRYFDEGCGGGNKDVNDGGSPGLASSGGSAGGPADASSAIVEGGPRPSAEEATPAATEAAAAQALPHRPLDKRACEVLVRDASVLVTDPSFLGRLNTGFDDHGSGGGGGGLGFFDVATGGTAAAAGGAGIGMAPHSWLLKARAHVWLQL